MTTRPTVAADLGKHLGDELQSLVQRHRQLAEGGGASASEWAAAQMIAIEVVAVQALAGVVVLVSEGKRGELFDTALLKLLASINDRRGIVLKAAMMTDALCRTGRGTS